MENILIVDDQEIVLRTIARLLAGDKFNIVTTTDPTQAIEMMSHQKFACVITDVKMPKMSGVELLKRIKAIDPLTQVILCTGFANIEWVREAMIYDASEYLIKPVRQEEFQRAIARALDKRNRILYEKDQLRRIQEKNFNLGKTVVETIEKTLLVARSFAIGYDEYWGKHAEAMYDFAVMLVDRMGLDRQVRFEIGLAAKVADFGIVVIEKSAVERFELSGNWDMQMLERHIRLSGKIARTLFANERVAMIVEQHHENFDGTGPLQLAGDQIHVGARIMRIADLFHYYLSERPNKPPMTPPQARSQMRNHLSKEVDPELASVFLSVAEEQGQQFSKYGYRIPIKMEISEVLGEHLDKTDSIFHTNRNDGVIEVVQTDEEGPVVRHISKKEIIELLQENNDIAAIPFVAGEIIRAANRSSTSVDDLVRLVNQDPGITAALLKIANSSVYTTGKQITETKAAIMRLGVGGTGELVASLSLIDKFGDSPNNLSSRPEWFWEHCIAVGQLAYEIAEELKLDNPEELYIAGIFHDMGRVLFDRLIPDIYHPILRWCREKGRSVLSSELRELGMTHTDMLKYFFEIINLPRRSVVLSQHHHASTAQILRDSDSKRMLILALSNALAKVHMFGNGGDGLLEPLSSYAMALKVENAVIEDVVDRVMKSLNQSKGIFMMRYDARNFEPYSSVLLDMFKRKVYCMYLAHSTRQINEVKMFLQSLRVLWTPEDDGVVPKPKVAVLYIQNETEVDQVATFLEAITEENELGNLPLVICKSRKLPNARLGEITRGRDAIVMQTPVHMEHLVQSINKALEISDRK